MGSVLGKRPAVPDSGGQESDARIRLDVDNRTSSGDIFVPPARVPSTRHGEGDARPTKYSEDVDDGTSSRDTVVSAPGGACDARSTTDVDHVASHPSSLDCGVSLAGVASTRGGEGVVRSASDNAGSSSGLAVSPAGSGSASGGANGDRINFAVDTVGARTSSDNCGRKECLGIPRPRSSPMGKEGVPRVPGASANSLPDCINSSNPFHECSQYCVERIADAKSASERAPQEEPARVASTRRGARVTRSDTDKRNSRTTASPRRAIPPPLQTWTEKAQWVAARVMLRVEKLRVKVLNERSSPSHPAKYSGQWIVGRRSLHEAAHHDLQMFRIMKSKQGKLGAEESTAATAILCSYENDEFMFDLALQEKRNQFQKPNTSGAWPVITSGGIGVSIASLTCCRPLDEMNWLLADCYNAISNLLNRAELSLMAKGGSDKCNEMIDDLVCACRVLRCASRNARVVIQSLGGRALMEPISMWRIRFHELKF